MKLLVSFHVWIGLLVIPGFVASAAELVRNGDFKNVLSEWAVPEQLTVELPYSSSDQAVDLHPWVGHRPFGAGTVVSQPVNLPVEAGMTLPVAIDLRSNWAMAEGQAMGVYLEFLDSDGMCHRQAALQPENAEISDTEWRRFEANHIVAEGMVKLVGVALDAGGSGSLLATNVSVVGPVPGGPVPRLGSISPSQAAYGETVTLRGLGFGESAGRVLVGGSTEGVDILGWSDTEIQIALADPATGGPVVVEVEGVRTWQTRGLRVTSPYFTFSVKPTFEDYMNGSMPRIRALPGQSLRLAAFLRFFNGYEPLEVIDLSAEGVDAEVIFNRNPIRGEGGTVVSLDLADVGPGVHTVEFQAADGMMALRTSKVEIEVVDVDAVVWYEYNGEALAGTRFESQGAYQVYPRFYDAQGEELWGFQDELTLSSSHPLAIGVFHEKGFFGSFSILVHDSAEATLATVLPDGKTFTTNVEAVIPDEPRIVSSGFLYPTMTNFPGAETGENRNMLNIVGSASMSRIGAGWSAGLVSDGFVGSGNVRGWAFYAGESLNPGSYLITGRGEIDGQWYNTARILNVINDPETGYISGRVVDYDSEHETHGVYGTLELYDAVSGGLVQEIEVWGDAEIDGYTVSRVPPGAYKLRWRPDDFGMGEQHEPYWFPNARDFDGAETVAIEAGEGILNIDFLLVPSAGQPLPPRIVGDPSFNPVDRTFAMTLAAENDQRFDLQKSVTMAENTWITVDSAWGWNGTANLTDYEAHDEKAFYRVVPR